MNRTRRSTLAGLLVALIVAAGYSLAGIPNVELVTLLIFVSGFLLGPRLGPFVGAIAWGLFSGFNPMGAAVPPVLAAQIAVGAIVGLAGGWLGPVVLERTGRWIGMLLYGATGLVLTLLFQFAVNTAFFAVFADERSWKAFWIFVAGGVAFTAMHLVWNTVVFGVALRPVLKVLDGYRRELRS